jgi:hypothetical protein
MANPNWDSTDHFNINNFSGPGDGNYRYVSEVIKDFVMSATVPLQASPQKNAG